MANNANGLVLLREQSSELRSYIPDFRKNFSPHSGTHDYFKQSSIDEGINMEIAEISIKSEYVFYAPGMYIHDMYPMMYGCIIISTDRDVLDIFRSFNRCISAKVLPLSQIITWLAEK